ncbi:DUF418 domain-containing protein [Sediminibacillus dalangtanensis]|uniref:DUF418 domain-containing protein n=1 Tax=Sediminibacillus dalangtanensis TaxID=2729421 RepID=A0ABX7VP49_9BACI|nr:DUF418 domain-containing protein [Sediminibacillus dalangtanensis]QTM98661.1 DUF418 domain-containing protein [Sediminibacillus dalangtanensis]
MTKTGSPLNENQRLIWIDAARGLAILGIFMVNAPAFNAPFFLYGGAGDYWDNKLDHAVQTGIDIFFQASFYTLFSFLFGFGMQVMYDRLQEKKQNTIYVLVRRLVVLICFGIIHAFLIWHGDILLSYGIIGFWLFCFYRRQNRTLLGWSLGLLLIPTGLLTMLSYAARNFLSDISAGDSQRIAEAMANYGEGSLLDILRQNAADWLYANGGIAYLFLTFSLLPMFLLGMYASRKRWLHDTDRYRSVLVKLWIWTCIVFILMKVGPYIIGNPFWLNEAKRAVGGSASALFYVLSVTLAFRTKYGRMLLMPLASVGRMSLTNYLGQSLICFFLFYSAGLGLYGAVRPIYSVVLVLMIFSLQIFLSKWWFRYFRFGPAEWLWRSLTYGEKQQLRRRVRSVD